MASVYQCSVCNGSFGTESELYTHYNLFFSDPSHKQPNTFTVAGILKRYKCELCDYHSNRKRNVVRHKSNKHGMANRNGEQPTVGYGGAHSETRPLQPYAESLDTEYESECS